MALELFEALRSVRSLDSQVWDLICCSALKLGLFCALYQTSTEVSGVKCKFLSAIRLVTQNSEAIHRNATGLPKPRSAGRGVLGCGATQCGPGGLRCGGLPSTRLGKARAVRWVSWPLLKSGSVVGGEGGGGGLF